MKEYFVFQVNKEVFKLYKDNLRGLFSVFNKIYYMNLSNTDQGINLYNQVAILFNKKEIDTYLIDILKDKTIYSYVNDEHIINNIFLNEISILKVKNSYIKINSNCDNSTFFKVLVRKSKFLFVCDFKNQDYFLIKDIKMLV